MAKGKVNIIYQESYKKGTSVSIRGVQDIIDQNKEKITAEIVNRGKMSDESEFITVKLIIAK